MANWTDIDTNSLLPGEPITSALMLAYEENDRALAAQASGAPKIADKTLFVSSASGNSVTTSGFDDFGGVWIDATYSYVSGGSQTLEIAFSDDGSTFYGTTSLLVVDASETPAMMRGFFDFASGDYKWIGAASGGGTQSASGTVSGLSLDVTHIRITFSAAGGAGGAVIFQPQGGESAA